MSSACDTFIADSVYLVLNSLLDWQPVERLKQSSDAVSLLGGGGGELLAWFPGTGTRAK